MTVPSPEGEGQGGEINLSPRLNSGPDWIVSQSGSSEKRDNMTNVAALIADEYDGRLKSNGKQRRTKCSESSGAISTH